MAWRKLVLVLFLCAWEVTAQTARPKDLIKGGADSLPQLQQYLKSADAATRLEAVKAIVEIGGPRGIDALVEATRDNDPEVQMRATDGLVNAYLPGYVKTGLTASIGRVGSKVKSRFTDTNDQVIPGYLEVRPDVVAALGKLARGGARMEVRANAARAIGILRGRAALPDLFEAIQSKETDVIYESLIAIQKIRDETAAARISFLLNDLNQRVQIAAIETAGLLRNREALPELRGVLQRAKDVKVRRAALTAIAMLPEESSRPLYTQYLNDKDDRMRGAAAEGYARLKNPADLPMLEKTFNDERKTSPRLSLAYALVMLGKTEVAELTPLRYLIDTLNSTAYKGDAYAFLVELARTPGIRDSLYRSLVEGTKDEKIQLSRVMAMSGDSSAIPHLEKVSHDANAEVAEEGLRALRTVKARQ